jgi:hypothetical protein
LLVSSLRSKGYKEDRNLSDSFYAFKNYSKSELDEKGFYFDIYQRKGSFWVAFRGTANFGGGVADLKQIMNIDVDQSVYEYANQLIAFLTGKKGIDPSRIATTGHSLGGGLATYSHLLNSAAFALNFNPAELGAANNVRVPNDAVRTRVINYLSYEPGSETADFVHQGTRIAKELIDSPKIPEGYIYGNSYYLPIEIGPSNWHLAKKLAIASGSRKIVTTGVRKFAMHPIISTAKVGYAGAKTYVDIDSTEQATWANFQLHSLDPLAHSISNLISTPRQFVCGMPAQSSGVKTQLKPQSRWEALKKVRPNRKQVETDGLP